MDRLWIFGVVGGAIPDAIRIIQGRYKLTLPDYLKRFNFWLGFILLLAIGGLVAWLGKSQSIQEALAYGFAAPEILSRLLSTSTPSDLASPGPTVRHFWSY
jgi:hypothetical protein